MAVNKTETTVPGFTGNVNLVATVPVDPVSGAPVAAASLGRAPAASSEPVALSNEDFTRLGLVALGGATATVASVPSATGATTLKSANPNRVGLIITNDSTAILYVLFGTGMPSATNYTFQMPAKGTTPFDRPISGYTGLVQGAWATANGFAMVTEVI